MTELDSGRRREGNRKEKEKEKNKSLDRKKELPCVDICMNVCRYD